MQFYKVYQIKSNVHLLLAKAFRETSIAAGFYTPPVHRKSITPLELNFEKDHHVVFTKKI